MKNPNSLEAALAARRLVRNGGSVRMQPQPEAPQDSSELSPVAAANELPFEDDEPIEPEPIGSRVASIIQRLKQSKGIGK
jgi:hypothetical protein